jgi:hypothetical protein
VACYSSPVQLRLCRACHSSYCCGHGAWFCNCEVAIING